MQSASVESQTCVKKEGEANHLNYPSVVKQQLNCN